MKENAIGTIWSLIASLKIPVTKTTVIKEVNDNPHNQTLFGISDVLSKWNITNAAYHLSADELDGEFCPFIAFVNKGIKEYEFVFVKSMDDLQVTICNENYQNKVIERDRFNKLYNGTALIIEPEAGAGEFNYKANRKKEIIERLKVPLVLLIGLACLAGFFMDSHTSVVYGLYLLLLKCAGLSASLVLVTQTLQADNPLAKTFCIKGKHAECDDIVTGKGSRLFSWLSWSEIGMLYFAGTLLLLLFSYNVPGVAGTTALFSALCLPYMAYSLSYQAFVAKKWCVLCCTVQLVLLLEFFANLEHLADPLRQFSAVTLYRLFVSMMSPVMAWIIIKPMFKNSGELLSARKTLIKVKNNDELFKKILSEQPAYNLPEEDFAIILGNPASKKIVTIVSNPYCGPCANTHKELNDWLSVTEDLQVRVILTNTPQSRETARHLVAINNTGDPVLIRQALHDWYKQSQKDYTSWAKKYPADLQSALCDDVLEKQSKWCEVSDVRFTPLVIVNGHQLPDSYQIEDLRYLV